MNSLLKRTFPKFSSLNKKSTLPQSLLSPVTFQNVVFTLNWGSVTGGIPFEYDELKNCLVVTTKSVAKWRIVMTIQLLNFAHFLFNLVYLVLSQLLKENDITSSSNNATATLKQPTLFDIAFTFIVTMLTISMLILSISVGSFHRAEVCSLINGELQFLVYLKGKNKNASDYNGSSLSLNFVSFYRKVHQ